MGTETITIKQKMTSRKRGLKFQRTVGKGVSLLLLTLGSLMVMLPLVWMLTTSLKNKDAATSFPPQWIPHDSKKAEIDGKSYFLYTVPTPDGEKELALVKVKGKNVFVDPTNPDIRYENIAIKDAKRVQYFKLHWENYKNAMTMQPFIKYTQNTLIIVITTTIGVLISCTLVAFGFARYRAPGLDIFFLVLLSTIMLPPQVTLIPTFVLFQKIGWYNTYWPLIVPSFFANAWDVFLLRQFFMTIPYEMDEAATIDGAGTLQILLYVIIPQSWPAIATVSIFHFLWAWNDFFGPLIYIQDKDKWTLALGLQSFNAMYSRQTTNMMAAATVTMLPCLLLFFLAQKLFIQGVVISGIKG